MPLAGGEGAKDLGSELEVFTDIRHVPREALAVLLAPLVFIHTAKDTNQFVGAFLDVKVVLNPHRLIVNFFEVGNLRDTFLYHEYQAI